MDAPPATFEDAYRELQDVIERLEDGGVPLETALSLFERGMALAATCDAIVENAQLVVTRLSPDLLAESAF